MNRDWKTTGFGTLELEFDTGNVIAYVHSKRYSGANLYNETGQLIATMKAETDNLMNAMEEIEEWAEDILFDPIEELKAVLFGMPTGSPYRVGIERVLSYLERHNDDGHTILERVE